MERSQLAVGWDIPYVAPSEITGVVRAVLLVTYGNPEVPFAVEPLNIYNGVWAAGPQIDASFQSSYWLESHVEAEVTSMAGPQIVLGDCEDGGINEIVYLAEVDAEYTEPCGGD